MQHLKRIIGIEAREASAELKSAVDAWKRDAAAASTGLSWPTRARILRLAREERTLGTRALPRQVEPAFATAPRLATLALASAAVLGLALFSLPRGGDASRSKLQARKSGNQVIFTIANGHRAHRVFKSSDVDPSKSSPFTTTRGSFRDDLRAGPDLVFYRID